MPRGYLRELPRLTDGAMRGCPSVYGLCIDYLRHTDARVDLNILCQYVQSYQTVRQLTIGELWAVPIMLRLGLLLTVSAIAAAETSSRDRPRGDDWADKLLAGAKTPSELPLRLLEIERGTPITAAFLVQLTRRLREHDEPVLGVVFDWIAVQSAKLGAVPEELVRRQLLHQAADQVSVGNAVTSMRAIAAFDWHEFFERTSAVEALLGKDPAGAYATTDPNSRDRYRHAVEALARRGRSNELGVAQAALELAKQHAPEHGDRAAAQAHVGYYLLDDGRRELERRLAYRPRLGERIRRAVTSRPSAFYFGAIGLVTAALCSAAAAYLGAPNVGLVAVVLLVLLVMPAMEVAIEFVNALVVSGLRPRLLSRFAFDDGIPREHRTLVAVPALLESRQVIDRLLEDLEVRSLANADPHLHFALLTDFVDADSPELPGDGELLLRVEQGIRALNERHGDGQRYWLFHRRRLENRREGRFMGWDRKRGKLEELNRLLRGAADTSFSVVLANEEWFSSIRYVITLDADTELPRDTARKLVATLAHPLNRPVVDPAKRRVVRGYGIAQPRVGTLPQSSRESRFAAIAAGPPGIDPYTTAVSDVYQDLFGEGSYVGKGIYDVDAFAAVLKDRVPENLLLSHDLFEGLYARSALVTDVEVLDEQPSAYEVQAGRQHRWIRGDWQLVQWLLPRVPTRASGRRRSDLRLHRLVEAVRQSAAQPAGCDPDRSRADWLVFRAPGERRGERRAGCGAVRATGAASGVSAGSRFAPALAVVVRGAWRRSAHQCDPGLSQPVGTSRSGAALARRHRTHGVSPDLVEAPPDGVADDAPVGTAVRCRRRTGRGPHLVQCRALDLARLLAIPVGAGSAVVRAARTAVLGLRAVRGRLVEPAAAVAQADGKAVRRRSPSTAHARRQDLALLRDVRHRTRQSSAAGQLSRRSARRRGAPYLAYEHRPVLAVGRGGARSRARHPARPEPAAGPYARHARAYGTPLRPHPELVRHRVAAPPRPAVRVNGQQRQPGGRALDLAPGLRRVLRCARDRSASAGGRRGRDRDRLVVARAGAGAKQ